MKMHLNDVEEFIAGLDLASKLKIKEILDIYLDSDLADHYKKISEQLAQLINDLERKGLELIVRIDGNEIPVKRSIFDIRVKEKN